MTRYPGAIWRPGPAWKTNGAPRHGKGIILHSAEGSLGGAFGQLDGPIELSWPFTNDLDGTLYQHYEIEAQCWHAHAANGVYVGVEHPNEYTNGHPNHNPFTPAQVATDNALIAWLAALEAWPGWIRRQTLWEHNEADSVPTNCPSGRVPWAQIVEPAPAPGPRRWLYGDEAAGLEIVGDQQWVWNMGVNVDRLGGQGDEAGLRGTHYHNAGGNWHKVLD